MKRIYVGVNVGKCEVFKADAEPTRETHGSVYAMVIGPFRTMRGARWMADPVRGQGNPHCRCVRDAEYLAKKYA